MTLGTERSELASKSSVLMRIMLRDAASARCRDNKGTESRGPRSKNATTVIRMVERRVTPLHHSGVATGDVLLALNPCRSLVYGVYEPAPIRWDGHTLERETNRADDRAAK